MIKARIEIPNDCLFPESYKKDFPNRERITQGIVEKTKSNIINLQIIPSMPIVFDFHYFAEDFGFTEDEKDFLKGYPSHDVEWIIPEDGVYILAIYYEEENELWKQKKDRAKD